MANPNYAELRERKAIKSPSGNALHESGSSGVPSMPYRCPDWGLKGLPKQPRDRSLGVKKLKVNAKDEGL